VGDGIMAIKKNKKKKNPFWRSEKGTKGAAKSPWREPMADPAMVYESDHRKASGAY